jgi:uncharacterized damage-inducible protein DinB
MVLQQYDYNVWANQQICRHLLELPEATVHHEIVSVIPTIYDALIHIYVIDGGWLNLMTAGGVTEMTPDYVEQLRASTDQLIEEVQGKSVAQFDTIQQDMAERLRVFINHHEDLDALCSFGTFQARYAELIQHIVNHGTYHRGNITAMLRQLGYTGVQTDYSLYLYTKN